MMMESQETKVLKALPNFLNTFGTKFTNCICCGEDIEEETLEDLKEEAQRSHCVLKDICIKSVAYDNNVLSEAKLDHEDLSFPFCQDCVSATILKLTESYRQLQVVQEGFNEIRHILVAELIRCYVKVFFKDQAQSSRRYPSEEAILADWKKLAFRNTWESHEVETSEVRKNSQETQKPKRRFDLSQVKIEVSESDAEDEIVVEEVGIVASNDSGTGDGGEDFDGFETEDFCDESISEPGTMYEVKQEPTETPLEIRPTTYCLRKSLDAVIDDDLAPINQVVANALGNFRPGSIASVKPPKQTNSKVSCLKGENLQSKVSNTKRQKKESKKASTSTKLNDVPEPRRSSRFQVLKKSSTKAKKLRTTSSLRLSRESNKKSPASEVSTRIGRKDRSKSKSVSRSHKSPSSRVTSEPQSSKNEAIEPKGKVDDKKVLALVRSKRALRSSVGTRRKNVPKTEDQDPIKNEYVRPESPSLIEVILPDSPCLIESHSQDDFHFETEENSYRSSSCVSEDEEDSKGLSSSDTEFVPPIKMRVVKKKKNSSPGDIEVSNNSKDKKPTKEIKKRIRKPSSVGSKKPAKQKKSELEAKPSMKESNNASSDDVNTKKRRKPPQPAQCSVCGKILCSSYNLTLHMRTHSGEKPYPCPHCPMRFLKPPNLKAHLLKHTREKQYCCELCGATFGYPQVLRSHKASLHQIYDHVYTFECKSSDGKCHKKYITPGEMAKHLRQNHFVDQHADISPFCKIQCVVCDLKIPDMNIFNEHIKSEEHVKNSKVHKIPGSHPGNGRCDRNGDQAAAGVTGANNSETCVPTSNSNVIANNKTHPDTSPLTQKSDTPKWPQKCRAEGCDMQISNETNMRLHLQKCHRQRNHTCDVCNKAFMEKSHLRQHKIIHLDPGDKPFCCDECDKKFNTHASLKSHKMKHTGEGLQNCNHCEKTFTKLKVFRKHMCIQHPEEYLILEKFFCDCCFLTFKTEEELGTHQKIHEDFRCEQCGRLFEYNCELVRHIQNHDKPFKCDQCDKSWVTDDALKEHVARKHAKEKLFRCDKCGMAFYGEKWLNNHVNRVHNGKVTLKTRQKKRRRQFAESSSDPSSSSDDDDDNMEDDRQDPLMLKNAFGQQLVYDSSNPESYMMQVHLLPDHSHIANR